MDLPVMPPVKPMLAKAVAQIPDLGHVEPKWDGFRTIVFRDGDEVELGSRNERAMTRYFPEVVEAVKANTPNRCVIDGEIVVIGAERLEFETLQQRIHPAASRVKLLSAQTPASFIGFDLLALGDEDLMQKPFAQRRAMLLEALAKAEAPVYCTPATGDMALAQEWFGMFEGAGLDGVVAKPLDGLYLPDKRTMFKVKHARTADCVVAGFRWHKSGPIVGSLLLGLWSDDAETGLPKLQHVGVAASFPMARRAELVDELAPYRLPDDELGHPPLGPVGGGSGARARPDAGQRQPLERHQGPLLRAAAPDLVVEVAYDQMEGTRFRHTAQFRRWRTDREPTSCSYDQLEQVAKYRLADVLGAR